MDSAETTCNLSDEELRSEPFVQFTNNNNGCYNYYHEQLLSTSTIPILMFSQELNAECILYSLIKHYLK